MKGFPTGSPDAIDAGRKGGRIRGEQKKRESLARLEAEFPGIPAEALQRIRHQGYQAGYLAGVKKAASRHGARTERHSVTSSASASAND